MAKRSRISSRPGQRRPTQRTTPRPAETTTPEVVPEPVADDAPPPASRSGLTDAEEARAAEIEARLVAQEKAEAAATKRARERTRGGRPVPSSVPLSVRAAEEYAYVRRDLRRISLTAVFLFALLIVLFIAFNAFHLFGY